MEPYLKFSAETTSPGVNVGVFGGKLDIFLRPSLTLDRDDLFLSLVDLSCYPPASSSAMFLWCVGFPLSYFRPVRHRGRQILPV